MEKKNKITMNDIAREAGVSQATVSLILNNAQSIKLSDETRLRVINTAQMLGYKKLPSPQKVEGQEEIAIIINSMPSYDPFVDALSQARDAAWRNDMLLTIYDYGDDIDLALRIIRQLEQRRCTGIVLASPITRSIDFSLFDHCTAMPLVLLNVYDRAYPLQSTFLPDDYANALQVTRHLINQGARRIAHIMGDDWMDASHHRLSGYKAALEHAGIPFDDALVIKTNWRLDETHQATYQVMRLSSRPDAIFCSSDWMTLGCYQALAEMEVKVPQDILVAGYDDQRIAEQLLPKLTSVQLPYIELSRMAVEYLCQGECTPTHVKMAGKLLIRGSTMR